MDKSAYENYLVTLISLNVAVNEDNAPNSAKFMEQMLVLNAAGQWAKPADIISMLQNVGVVHYRTKDYAQAASWMERNLKKAELQRLPRSYVSSRMQWQETSSAPQNLGEEEIVLANKEGRAPAEPYLELLAQARNQLKDAPGGTRAIELFDHALPEKSVLADTGEPPLDTP